MAAPRQHRSLPQSHRTPTSGAAQRVSERRRIRRQLPSLPDKLVVECWSLLDCLACWLDKTTVACFVGHPC